MLNGSHMQNDTGFALDHACQEVLVASHSRKQVHTKRFLPVFRWSGPHSLHSEHPIRRHSSPGCRLPPPLAKDTVGELPVFRPELPKSNLNEKRRSLIFGQRRAGCRGDFAPRTEESGAPWLRQRLWFHPLPGTRLFFELFCVDMKGIVILHLGISSVAQRRVCHHTIEMGSTH